MEGVKPGREERRRQLEAEIAVRRARRLGELPRAEPLARQVAEHLAARAASEQLAALRAASRRSVLDEMDDIIEPPPDLRAGIEELPELPELPEDLELPER